MSRRSSLSVAQGRMEHMAARQSAPPDAQPGTLPDLPSGVDALSGFSPATRDWFTGAFAAPTPAQAQAWAAIAKGDNTLVIAPTGSGKTLAAFLWALDRLAAAPPPPNPKLRCRVLYISPLKALADAGQRCPQVAFDVYRQGLQRRDVQH